MAKKTISMEPAGDASYTKAQLLSSDRYKAQKDMVQALLDPLMTYSLEQVDEVIEKFMKGRVK